MNRTEIQRDKTDREVLLDYYESVKAALAYDIIQWADARGEDNKKNITIAMHAGRLSGLRDALRLFPVPKETDDSEKGQP